MNVRQTLRRGLALSLSVSLIGALSAGSAAAGVKVKLEDVPKAAVKAVQDRFAKATISNVDRETNGDFEFTLKEGERLFDVGVKPDGKLLNIKEELAEDKLPAAVKEGLQKAHLGAKIVETEKVTVIGEKSEKVTYEMKIKVDKQTLEVALDEAGVPVKD